MKQVTIGRLLVVSALICAAAPAFATLGFDIAGPPVTTAGMAGLGLLGLALAGSPRKRREPSEPHTRN